MNHGATVQAGHTAAARNASESGISKEDWDKQQMQELHSRKGQGLDVTVTDKAGSKKVTSRHRSQEGLIDSAVDRIKEKNAGKLSPQGQLDAAEEVRWRTENVPMDQRDVDTVRTSGPAKPASLPDPKVQTTAKGAEAALENGAKEAPSKLTKFAKGAGAVLLEKGGKLIPFAGTGVGAALAISEARAGNYAAAVVEAAGASEVPILAQVADGGSLAAEIAWVAKDILDPDQELEGWYYRTFLQ